MGRAGARARPKKFFIFLKKTIDKLFIVWYNIYRKKERKNKNEAKVPRG